jgi:hypothetical protein
MPFLSFVGYVHQSEVPATGVGLCREWLGDSGFGKGVRWKGRMTYTGVPPYPRVIRSKTYRGYVKPRIIPNAIYIVIFV